MILGEQLLRCHLQSGRFLAGVAKQRWRLISVDWPSVFVEVRAADSRCFVLKFECTGYPDDAPTATLWDIVDNQQLSASAWPRGGRVSKVFNPRWKSGKALYIPCDRQSIEGHGAWVSEHPWLIWDPDRGLLQYIEAVCEILHSGELERDVA